MVTKILYLYGRNNKMFSKELAKYMTLPEKLNKERHSLEKDYSCKEKPIFYLILKSATKSS